VNSVKGSIFAIHHQILDGGARTSFRLRSESGQETLAETPLDFPWREGDMVQASGEVNSDLVLIAVSIAPLASLPPPEKPKLYKVRAILAAILGGVAGLFAGIVNDTFASSASSSPWLYGLVGTVVSSAALGWILASSNRKANAWLGARISFGIWLFFYLLHLKS
jgi:hypothetical protein